jgi:hypothetical protein
MNDMNRPIDLRWLMRVAALAAAGFAGVAQAADAPSYSEDLAALFNEHQRVLVLRDACITAQPGQKAEVGGAYEDWLNRHSRIVDDLDNRFAAIIKRASKDQAEYSRNYGKYQSEVLQLREENKKALLANREKLAQQCAELPGYLRHPKSDIPVLYPAEFKRVYRLR